MVRMRRSLLGAGAFTPGQLGTKLLAWWDAEHSDLITIDGSNRIASWADRIGGLTLAQGTDANKPVLGIDGDIGIRAAAFDGSNDVLTVEATTGLPTGAELGEIWALVKQAALVADTTTRFVLTYGGITGNARRSIERIVDTDTNRLRATSGTGGGSMQNVTVTAVAFDGWHVVRCVVSALGLAAGMDSAELTAVNAFGASGTGTTRVRMGAASSDTPVNFWNGSVAAVLVTGALTDDEAEDMARWLNARRGVV